ncbi:MAG: hypothetical protein HYZ72_03885 [Deltaproteobacteria bacterium]|nr:hypothetical protein [Deltaproteobacteria bacterium]
MVEGRVNENLEPVVEIGLQRRDTITTIQTVVDTGFSGTLCLAERHIDLLDLEFKFVERYELANGEVIVKDVFRGRVVFDEREQEVDLILTTSQDTLIGASLLQDYRLSIDYPGGTVRIERTTPNRESRS